MYTSKERVGKHTPSKDIPLETGEPLKEIRKMLEEENDKQVHTSTGIPLKNSEIPNDKKENTNK